MFLITNITIVFTLIIIIIIIIVIITIIIIIIITITLTPLTQYEWRASGQVARRDQLKGSLDPSHTNLLSASGTSWRLEKSLLTKMFLLPLMRRSILCQTEHCQGGSARGGLQYFSDKDWEEKFVVVR